MSYMIFDKNIYLKAPAHFHKEAHDYMLIDPTRKYIVSIARVSMSAPRALVSPVSYLELNDNSVKVRLAGASSCIVHGCRKEATGVWWEILGKDHFWEYVPIEQVPEWAHEAFAEGTAKLEGDHTPLLPD